jgi:hypothetical protein
LEKTQRFNFFFLHQEQELKYESVIDELKRANKEQELIQLKKDFDSQKEQISALKKEVGFFRYFFRLIRTSHRQSA